MGVQLIVGTQKGVATYVRGAGGTWSSQFDLPGWSVTASARDDAGTVYLGVASEVFGAAVMRRDANGDWTQCASAPRYQDSDEPNEVHNHIIRAGLEWNGTSGPGRHVDQIWTLHAANGRIYAGVSEAGLFVSDDGGDTWQGVDGLNNHPSRAGWEPGAGGLCCHTILSDPTNPNRLWVGISAAGFFRTDDGGKTFVPKNEGVNADTGQCVHCVTHNPAAPNHLYRQEHRGVHRSLNGGDTWEVIEDGLPVVELSDGYRCSFGFPIAMDHASGNIFVVPLSGDGQRMPAGGDLTVYRSANGGDSWQAMSQGLPDAYYGGILRGAMDADQASPGGVYFGTSSGDVFASSDLGETWGFVARGLPRVQSVRAYVN